MKKLAHLITYIAHRSIGIAAAVAMIAAMAACSDSELLADSNDETATVTFSIALPEDVQTRAYGDGKYAVYLTYAVYKRTLVDNQSTPTDTILLSETRMNAFANGTAKLQLNLTKYQDYDVVFWADAGADSPYIIDLSNKTVNMGYGKDLVAALSGDDETTVSTTEGTLGNNEKRDAFFHHETIENLLSTSSNISLRRPFAQFNVGCHFAYSSDVAALSGQTLADDDTENSETTVTTQKSIMTLTLPADYFPDVLDITTGEASYSWKTDGSTSSTPSYGYTHSCDDGKCKGTSSSTCQSSGKTVFDITAEGIPDTTLVFPVTTDDGTTYKYLMMNYLLVADQEDDETTDEIREDEITIGTQNDEDETTTELIIHSNLIGALHTSGFNLRRNMKTNLYGDLLPNFSNYESRSWHTDNETADYPFDTSKEE